MTHLQVVGLDAKKVTSFPKIAVVNQRSTGKTLTFRCVVSAHEDNRCVSCPADAVNDVLF